MTDNYIQGMSGVSAIVEEMKSNMSEIEDEQNKTDEEYNREKEISLMQKQLMLSMQLTALRPF